MGSIIKGEDLTAAMVGNAIGTIVGDKISSKFTKILLTHGYPTSRISIFDGKKWTRFWRTILSGFLS